MVQIILVLHVQTACLKSPDQPCMGAFIHTFCLWAQELHLNLWPDFCYDWAISSPISGLASLLKPGKLTAP